MLPPIASFSSLPPETKVRVLELVAWQEQAWADRSKVAGEESRERHVNSLSAASLVCKEWRSLAVPHIFHTLTAQSARLPAFRHRILRQHGHRFARVVLESAFADDDDDDEDDAVDLEAWDYTLSLLPSLSGARSLYVAVAAAEALFGAICFDLAEGSTTDDAGHTEEEEMRAATLRSAVGLIDELILSDFHSADVHEFLSIWPRLKQLRLPRLAPESKEDFSSLLVFLHGVGISTLDVEFANMRTTALPKWTAKEVASFAELPPPLSVLQIKHTSHHQTDFDFISAFSDTLTTLDITLHHLHNPAVPPTPIDLPHLTSLRIKITNVTSEGPSVLSHFLATFASSPLVSLEICDGESIIDRSPTSPLTLLTGKFPSLRDLNITRTYPPITTDEFVHLSAFCADRGLAPPTRVRTAFDLRPTVALRIEQKGDVCDDLESVLKFGLLEVERVRRGGTIADAKEFLAALRPLDGLRRNWHD